MFAQAQPRSLLLTLAQWAPRSRPRRPTAATPPRRCRPTGRPTVRPTVRRILGKMPTLANFWHFFCKFLAGSFSAVSNEILQENMRSTAFFELYKICTLLHRCNLKMLAKSWYGFEKSAIYVKIDRSEGPVLLPMAILTLSDLNYSAKCRTWS